MLTRSSQPAQQFCPCVRTATAKSDSPQGQHKCSQMGRLELGWERDASVTRLTVKVSEEIHHAMRSAWYSKMTNSTQECEKCGYTLYVCFSSTWNYGWGKRVMKLQEGQMCVFTFIHQEIKKKKWKNGNGVNIHRRAHLWVEPYVCRCWERHWASADLLARQIRCYTESEALLNHLWTFKL